jgi:hypothetical protein
MPIVKTVCNLDAHFMQRAAADAPGCALAVASSPFAVTLVRCGLTVSVPVTLAAAQGTLGLPLPVPLAAEGTVPLTVPVPVALAAVQGTVGLPVALAITGPQAIPGKDAFAFTLASAPQQVCCCYTVLNCV